MLFMIAKLYQHVHITRTEKALLGGLFFIPGLIAAIKRGRLSAVLSEGEGGYIMWLGLLAMGHQYSTQHPHGTMSVWAELAVNMVLVAALAIITWSACRTKLPSERASQ
jgi:hypothetical protein